LTCFKHKSRGLRQQSFGLRHDAEQEDLSNVVITKGVGVFANNLHMRPGQELDYTDSNTPILRENHESIRPLAGVYLSMTPGLSIHYPLVNVYSLLLKMAIEIVDLTVKTNMVFQFALLVYQRMTLTRLAFVSENHKKGRLKNGRIIYRIYTMWGPQTIAKLVYN